MKKEAIIVDLDGTLCDARHRQHHMEGKKNWQAFYGSIPLDKPNLWCVLIIQGALACGLEVLFVSGRPREYEAATLDWLFKWNIHAAARNRLFMRPDGDFRRDSIVKTEIYKGFIEPHYEVLYCVDDRQQVVDAWRELGLTCLQCAKGDF